MAIYTYVDSWLVKFAIWKKKQFDLYNTTFFLVNEVSDFVIQLICVVENRNKIAGIITRLV